MPDTTIQATLGKYYVLLIGDGADPEVFAESCMFNSEKGIERSAATDSTAIPVCNPTTAAPARQENTVTETSWSISGSGITHQPDRAAMHAWWDSGQAKNIKIEVYAKLANGNRGALTETYSGAALMTNFSETGGEGNANHSLTLTGTGQLTLTPAV